jgi:hypothetical protein
MTWIGSGAGLAPCAYLTAATVGDTRRLFCQQVDNAMVKALARAFRWRDMLERGVHGTIKETASAETINESYHRQALTTDASGA